jgi:hypothetical protein
MKKPLCMHTPAPPAQAPAQVFVSQDNGLAHLCSLCRRALRARVSACAPTDPHADAYARTYIHPAHPAHLHKVSIGAGCSCAGGVQALKTPAQSSEPAAPALWYAVWHWAFHVKPYVKPFTDRATAERYVARQKRTHPKRRWIVEQRKEIA